MKTQRFKPFKQNPNVAYARAYRLACKENPSLIQDTIKRFTADNLGISVSTLDESLVQSDNRKGAK